MKILHKTGPERPEDGSIIVERLNIFIHCRIIKDHRKVVVLEASLMKPKMKIDSSNVMFQLPAVPLNPDEEWPPRSVQEALLVAQTVALHKFSESDFEDLSFRVKHAMGFFLITVVALWPNGKREVCTDMAELPRLKTRREESGSEIESEPLYVVEIRLNVEALKASRSMLLRDQYVEEHLRIYNSQQVFEKYVVHARLRCGDRYQHTSIRSDTFDLGHKGHSAANALEVAIVSFLQKHHKLWSDLFQEVYGSEKSPTSVANSSFEEGSGSLFVSSEEQLAQMDQLLYRLWSDADYNKLFMDYCFFTDELIYYALKGQASGADTHSFVGGLCSLLYSATLCNLEFDSIGAQYIQCGKPVPDLLLLWVEQLALLLSFFPENRSVSRPLRVLLNSLEWATHDPAVPVLQAALAAAGVDGRDSR